MCTQTPTHSRAYADWGYILFLCIVTLIGAVLLYRIGIHNPYLVFLFAWCGVHGGIVFLEIKVFPGLLTRRTRILWFVIAAFTAVAFFSLSSVPVTTVAVGIRYIPASLELVLIPADDGDASRARSAYAARGTENAVVEFVLPPSMRDTNESALLYFGRDSRAYDIFSLTYATDFLFWRIPVSVFEDREQTKMLRVDDQNALVHSEGALRLSSRVRSRPRVQISFDRERIVQNETPWAGPLVVALWLSVLLLTSAASIWRGWAARLRAGVVATSEKVRNMRLYAS